jgi:hypothetical protein
MNEKIPRDQPSAYLDFLPAIYRQETVRGQAAFVGLFLKIFEKILSGINDDVVLTEKAPESSLQTADVTGIEEVLEQIHEYFDPLFTPPFHHDRDVEEFIAYLSSWVALILDENW